MGSLIFAKPQEWKREQAQKRKTTNKIFNVHPKLYEIHSQFGNLVLNESS